VFSGEEKNPVAGSVSPGSSPSRENLVPDVTYELQQADVWCETAEEKKIAAQKLLEEADNLFWKAITVYQRHARRWEGYLTAHSRPAKVRGVLEHDSH
jgi:hypothetical protein